MATACSSTSKCRRSKARCPGVSGRSTRTDLGIDNALQTLRSFVEAAAANDVNLQQALKRIELQVTPVGGGPSTVIPVAGGAGADVVTTEAGWSAAAMEQQPWRGGGGRERERERERENRVHA